MKIKAGDNVSVGGDVKTGIKESPFWTHFGEISWLIVTVALIAATVILYAITKEIEVADLFAGLIGVAIGSVGHAIVQRLKALD